MAPSPVCAGVASLLGPRRIGWVSAGLRSHDDCVVSIGYVAAGVSTLIPAAEDTSDFFTDGLQNAIKLDNKQCKRQIADASSKTDCAQCTNHSGANTDDHGSAMRMAQAQFLPNSRKVLTPVLRLQVGTLAHWHDAECVQVRMRCEVVRLDVAHVRRPANLRDGVYVPHEPEEIWELAQRLRVRLEVHKIHGIESNERMVEPEVEPRRPRTAIEVSRFGERGIEVLQRREELGGGVLVRLL